MDLTDSLLIHVDSDEASLTLAALLKARLPDQSWSTVRKLIRTRQVLVNGNLCLDDARRLTENEVVKLLPHPTAVPPSERDVLIRFSDRALVVVEKPSGMTSVRHSEELNWSAKRKQFQPTLDEVLPQILAKMGVKKTRRGGPPVVRPVHRLDRETSGLIAFARSIPAERHLQDQFRTHSAQRQYLAVVVGHPAKQTIETKFVRDRGDGRRGSAQDEADDGKVAITHVEPIERLGAFTLVRCKLETGRTHQIRIHLAEHGHPVCGEKVYRKSKASGPEIADKSHAPRLALHAAELTLTHPETNEPMTFTSALPPDLEEFVNRLKGKR
jgi:23S rRNA pseudouridine1911/1915/1917 synthase